MNQITNWDNKVISYIRLMQGEYGDELLLQVQDVYIFWALSSVRKYSAKYYPFAQDADVLVVGDRFGAITGGICDLAHNVDAVVPDKYYGKAVKKRYAARDNLNILVREQDNWNLSKCYPYVCINLEYIQEINMNDTYAVDCMLNPSVEALEEDGKILIFATGEKLEAIKKILFKKGFSYNQSFDPLCNGALVLEASRKDNLSEVVVPSDFNLLNNKWIRKYEFPLLGGSVYDQDLSLIEDVKAVQLDLLKKLVSICNKNGLKLYPIYGTLLGTVREAGMIPGDDDIDVALPREDYEKLLNLQDEFQDAYVLQTPYNENCFFGGYSKLRNQNTTAIHPQNWWIDCCEGIGIDIFPIDNTYNDPEKERNKQRKIRILQKLLYAKAYGYFARFRDMKLPEWKGYKYLGKLFTKQKLVDCLYEEMKKGDKKSNRYAIYCHYRDNSLESARYMGAADFSTSIEGLYEEIPVQIPSGWDDLLNGFYGHGYWERQGFFEWKKRHGFYSVSIPYTVYKQRFGGLKNPGSIKEPIVLFGDGSLFKACVNNYKSKVNITHLVLLPGEDTIDSIGGIKVERWEDFLEQDLDRNAYRALICSGDVREAEKSLQKAGYDKYYIFWANREWMLYANQSQVWKEITNYYK